MSSPVNPAQGNCRPPKSETVIIVGVVTLLISLGWGAVWAVVTTTALDLDPWLGAQAGFVCPRICNRCTGPYHFLSYGSHGAGGSHARSTGGGNFVYCSHPNAMLDGPWITLMDNVGHNRPYEIPGGIWMIWLSSVLTWILPTLAAVLLFVFLRRKRA